MKVADLMGILPLGSAARPNTTISRANGENALIMARANDGSVMNEKCPWSDFTDMPNAAEVYMRDYGDIFHPKLKFQSTQTPKLW